MNNKLIGISINAIASIALDIIRQKSEVPKHKIDFKQTAKAVATGIVIGLVIDFARKRKPSLFKM
jgi:hypothetical protein